MASTLIFVCGAAHRRYRVRPHRGGTGGGAQFANPTLVVAVLIEPGSDQCDVVV